MPRQILFVNALQSILIFHLGVNWIRVSLHVDYEGAMQLRVTSLPGDGIGPEVTLQAIRVLEEVAGGFGHDLELDEKVPLRSQLP